MLLVDEWIKSDVPDVTMIMQVHDELVFEVPLTKSQSVADEIRSRMESAAELKVPLVVDVGMGTNWDEWRSRWRAF